ncbi:hypothetical protein [Streptomyces sp. NBC_01180]|uniref:hypothetical protein n=1 Tax=Streptomyces sp. NBC_01180 TaxID=2903763 RepID=UPI00386C67E6|nr:hypothetical protein OG708_17690 [Streptomyces sp. NBC_01180]
MSRSRTRHDRDQLRTARRDALLVLLSRAQRGVLSRPEAEQLRAHVETELRLADQTRASAGGHQAAIQRVQGRLVAAHAAIVEAEQRAEHAEQQLDDIRTPKPINSNHPLYPLLDAMTGPSVDQVKARALVGDYFRAITEQRKEA